MNIEDTLLKKAAQLTGVKEKTYLVKLDPLIIGELASGHSENRKGILSLLHALPMAIQIDYDELLVFIKKTLNGQGAWLY